VKPTPEPKTPPTAKPTPKPNPKPNPPTAAGGKLSEADVNKGIARAAGAVKTCKGPLPIRILVSYQITNDGKAKVKSVSNASGGALAQATKDCVERAVESKAKFPKNSDFKFPSYQF